VVIVRDTSSAARSRHAQAFNYKAAADASSMQTRADFAWYMRVWCSNG